MSIFNRQLFTEQEMVNSTFIFLNADVKQYFGMPGNSMFPSPLFCLSLPGCLLCCFLCLLIFLKGFLSWILMTNEKKPMWKYYEEVIMAIKEKKCF